MEIIVTSDPVDEDTLARLAQEWHGILVRGVADIERGVVALGGEWHMDAYVRLIEADSKQQNLWGFNVLPDERGDDAIEFLSLINIRPRQGNQKMEIQDAMVREKVRAAARNVMPFLDL